MADGRAEIDAAIARYLEQVAVAIEADAKAGCPRRHRPAPPSPSTTRSAGDGRTARIGTNVDYALSTEFGSRPHRIYPRRPGGMLNFYWEKIGQDVTLPFVRHPGTPEQPFLRPALFRQRGAL